MTPVEYAAAFAAVSVVLSLCWCRVCAQRDRHSFVLDGRRTSGRVVTGRVCDGIHPHHSSVGDPGGGLVCKSHRAPITATNPVSPTFVAPARTAGHDTTGTVPPTAPVADLTPPTEGNRQ